MIWLITCSITKAIAKESLIPHLSNTDKTKKEEQYAHTQGYRDSQLFHHLGIYILYGGCKCFCKGRISVGFEQKQHNFKVTFHLKSNGLFRASLTYGGKLRVKAQEQKHEEK